MLAAISPGQTAGEISPFEIRLLSSIRQISRNNGGPASTVTISIVVGGVHERTVRRWLRRLERQGMVRRPSPKGGWLTVCKESIGVTR